jgi:hypothetical protein
VSASSSHSAPCAPGIATTPPINAGWNIVSLYGGGCQSLANDHRRTSAPSLQS